MAVRQGMALGCAALLGCALKEEGLDSGDGGGGGGGGEDSATPAETCDTREADVQDQILAAGRCEVDEDCVDVGSACPFGCSIPVHTDEAAAVSAQIQAWLADCATCDYDCGEAKDIQCQEGACVAIF